MKPLDIPPSATGRQIQALEFAYERSPDQSAAQPVRHALVVVGAGPVGLSLAIDLAQRGQQVLLLDNDNRLSTGSRAICFAKRTLEIWDRLGVGDRMVAKGVGWNVGKVFFRDELLYQFDLLPEAGHEPSAGPPQGGLEPPWGAGAGGGQGRTQERPAFINLQQYYAEAYLAERASTLPNLEIRWKNNVVALEQGERGTKLGIDTPDGRYELLADYVVACDGSRSSLRALLGEESHGRVFKDRFLIADVRMAAPPRALGRSEPGAPRGGPRSGEAAGVGAGVSPAERWFWFDPPFHRNQSVLLHMQPDGVWRIDFQLGWDANPEEEKKPENIIPRVKALLGADAKFELEWASVYTFACLRMDHFRMGRVLFAGDSAHGVSPFGARGANSGVQDAENLAWKLDLVLRGQAGDALLDSYASEREYAADENIRNSTRATDFITPKSDVSRLFRDAVLDLARHHPFARELVNSGRLSVPAILRESVLNTPDAGTFEGAVVPGAPAADAPLSIAGRKTWLLRELGQGFTLLVWDAAPAWAAGLPIKLLSLSQAEDVQGCLAQRYDLQPGTAYLLRPDQHVCARWRHPTEAGVCAALARACALH